MRVYELNKLSQEQKAKLFRRAESDIEELTGVVQPIIDDVRCKGDQALAEYTLKFDRVELQPDQFKVTTHEFETAYNLINPALHEAITVSYANIKKFHEKQMPVETWFTEVCPGVTAGEKTTPITSVGLYVPRGKGSFPSVTLMLGVPAAVAGVEKTAICTPPGPEGSVDPASLVAADMCSIRTIYKVGGAQAMAAFAYGTETVPKVRKILGPGSGYVAAAKRLLYGRVDVGPPAGPSEAIILTDEWADP